MRRIIPGYAPEQLVASQPDKLINHRFLIYTTNYLNKTQRPVAVFSSLRMNFPSYLLKILCVTGAVVTLGYLILIAFIQQDCEYRSQRTEEKLIFFHLRASENNGVGNVLFEVFAALGVARTLGRTPALSSAKFSQLRQIVKLPESFPNILESFLIKSKNTGRFVDYKYPGCCRMSNMTDVLAGYNDTVLSTYIQFAQTLGYWRNYKREEMLHLLKFTDNHVKIAREKMVDAKMIKGTHNLCVHVRRGDFIKSRLMETGENFTIHATNYVLKEVQKKKKSKIVVIFLGNDPKWEKEVAAKAKFGVSSIVVPMNKEWPAHIDWVFSQLYCDTVIQTAPFSTYGWLIAYLSRGQDVYYNKDFVKNKDLEKQFDVNDHFLPFWKKIELTKGAIREVTNVTEPH